KKKICENRLHHRAKTESLTTVGLKGYTNFTFSGWVPGERHKFAVFSLFEMILSKLTGSHQLISASKITPLSVLLPTF
ncbi:MAG: hypothetical protein PHV59_03105, partial [Victivallales bacterium]|nr:hypothetical protein [Victivallales bacterium]